MIIPNYLICNVISTIGTDVWETAGLSSRMFMLFQTSKSMKEAVLDQIHKPRNVWIEVLSSRLHHVTQFFTLTHVKIKTEEELSIYNIYKALPNLKNIVKLDMSGLIENKMDIDALTFCKGLGPNCPSLQELHLSILFIDAFTYNTEAQLQYNAQAQSPGPCDGGECWMSQIPKLRVLDLRNMRIYSNLVSNILVACNSCENLVELDLSNNEIFYVHEILSAEVTLYIKTLKMNYNGLGYDGDLDDLDDSDVEEEYRNTVENDGYYLFGIKELLERYTSLTSLSLGFNQFIEQEGIGIGNYLKTNTNIKYLDISGNFSPPCDGLNNIIEAWNGDPNRDPNNLKI
jgi:hypothetical protein